MDPHRLPAQGRPRVGAARRAGRLQRRRRRAPTGRATTGPATTGDRALPAGAIAVGPDLYQLPLGADAEGCMMYRLHSPTRMVTQAIAWRRPDGSFTLDRREAACAR